MNNKHLNDYNEHILYLFYYVQLKRKSKSDSSNKIKDYIDYIVNCRNINEKLEDDVYIERHHILPRHSFKEYKDLKIFRWNKIELTAYQHFKSHVLLGRLFPQSTLAISKMLKFNNLTISEDEVEEYKLLAAIAASNRSKGTIWIKHENGKNKMIEPSSLQKYLSKGWVLGRHNSQKNKIWITDGKEYKFTYCHDIPNGWFKGSALKDRQHAYDPITNKAIFVNKDKIPEDYILGNINAKGKYFTNKHTGEIKLFKLEETPNPENWNPGGTTTDRKWYYDPITKESYLIHINDKIPDNLVPGNISQFGISRTKGRKWYTNPDKTKSRLFLPNEQPEGWTLGRIFKDKN